jgi:phenylpropionate dioxygenase-like ring-hydroxylating dioxygenase large terminal subunit
MEPAPPKSTRREHSAVAIRSPSPLADPGLSTISPVDPALFLRNLWYYAMHGSGLEAGKLLQKEILGEKVVFGRTRSGKPFALRDNCPHRGIPLSEGRFDGELIECCYHGWQFDCSGECQKIPALVEPMANLARIKAQAYRCEEIHGTIWIFMADLQHPLADPETLPPLPDLLVPPGKTFLHVETVSLGVDIDHSAIGLIDPAHVTFVHQSWFWRTSRSAAAKEKHFEPVGNGFRMRRHQPSKRAGGKGYSLFRGGASTEITFELPGHRFEHIQFGESDFLVSLTLLTPVNETTTELNHIFFSTAGWMKFIFWPLARLGRAFICQDVKVFRKLNEGLKSRPKLMLIGDPDAQARWYLDLKKQWHIAQETGNPFVNPLAPATLRWVS